MHLIKRKKNILTVVLFTHERKMASVLRISSSSTWSHLDSVFHLLHFVVQLLFLHHHGRHRPLTLLLQTGGQSLLHFGKSRGRAGGGGEEDVEDEKEED